METIKSFKGFDKDLKCRGFQYKEGKTYTTDKAKACESGFHACENPIDMFSYYDPANSVFHEVEQSGDLDRHDLDSKIASTVIKIGTRINFRDIISATFEYVRSKTTNTEQGKDFSAVIGGHSSAVTGGDSSAVTGGYRSAVTGGYSSAVTGGYRSAVTGGDRSAVIGGHSSAVTGGDSSAVTGGYRSAVTGGYRSAVTGGYRSAVTGGDRSAVTGGQFSVCYGQKDSKVRGGLHSILALAEYDDDYNIIKVHAKVVDGEKIKADTFYTLKHGKFTITE